MDEEVLKAVYDRLAYGDRGISFEEFAQDMSDPEVQQVVWEKAGYDQRGISLEEFRTDLGVPIQATPAPVEQPSSWFGFAKQAFDRGLIQADQAGIGVDILADGEVSDEKVSQLIELNQASGKKVGSQAYAEMANAKGFGEWWNAFKKAPLQITTELAVESLTSFLKLGKEEIISGAVAGSVVPGLGNGVGALIGVGATSFQLEAGLDVVQTIQEEMEARGLDVNNAEHWREVLDDEDFLIQARKRAATRGGVVAAFDAVTGGLSGRIAKGGGKALIKAIKATTAEGIGGGLGEAAASIAVGDEVTAGAVMSEFIGEFGPGSVTIATQTIADPTRKAARSLIKGTNLGSPVDKKIYDLVLSDDPAKDQKIEQEIVSALEFNQITQEEADRLRSSIGDITEINNSIPAEISSKDRRKQVMDYIQQRRTIDTEIETLGQRSIDEAFQDTKDAKLADLKSQREIINERIKAESNPPAEIIPDSEYNDYFDNGNVSDDRLMSISEKISKGQALTDREHEFRNEFAREVDIMVEDIKQREQSYPAFDFQYLDPETLTDKTVSLQVGGQQLSDVPAVEAQDRIRSMVEKLNAVKPCL